MMRPRVTLLMADPDSSGAPVRELDSLPDGVDLVTASFPCIDVSRAGCRQARALPVPPARFSTRSTGAAA